MSCRCNERVGADPDDGNHGVIGALAAVGGIIVASRLHRDAVGGSSLLEGVLMGMFMSAAANHLKYGHRSR